MKALLIDYRQVRRINLKEEDGHVSLKDLQHRVGGYVEPFDPLFETVTLYVNEDGIGCCDPNRLIVANRHMAEEGYASPKDPCRPVTPGEPYTILHGNIIAVGHDPQTGEARSLTDGEEQEVRDYFHRASRPGSGVMAVLAIRAGR